MSHATAAAPPSRFGREEARVIFASSLGPVFEWYDFYLYATLAPFFASLFFPAGNATAALLSAFVTYAAGFLVRPFGALVFGRIGDIVGRKYTFLVTIVCMRSEEHTSELQSQSNLVCRLLLEKKKTKVYSRR